jgi:thymidine kinase
MIKLILGNVGSGKTASTVRWMREHKDRKIYTNIQTKGKDFMHVVRMTPDMIIEKNILSYKRDGTPIYEMKLNQKFWQETIEREKKIHVVIDEAHTFFNPRRSMSKVNVIMTDFLALLRRVLGSHDGTGELILITQLSRRLDIIAKEMATEVQYCVHHYKQKCSKCHHEQQETNETPIKMTVCPVCNSWYIKRYNSMIEVYHFSNVESFNRWYETKQKTYFARNCITDIHTVFTHYDTFQWADLISNY